MKKLISIIIILTMLVGLFSACTNQNQPSTDSQTDTDTINTDTETNTPVSGENKPVIDEKEKYYHSYHLLARDLKKGSANDTAVIVGSYEELKNDYLEAGIDTIDSSVFDENIVLIAFLSCSSVIGFKDFNGTKISCEALDYKSYDKTDEFEELEKSENNLLDYNYLVLIPKSECAFLYNPSIKDIDVQISTRGDYSVKSYKNLSLGEAPYTKVLKDKAEYDSYIKEVGIHNIPVLSQDKIIVAHYEPSYNTSRYAVAYQRGKLENKTLELISTEYFKSTTGKEVNSGVLSLITIPYNELVADPEFNVVINHKEHTNTIKNVENKSYIDYYKTIDIFYNDECSAFDYLPSSEGTYFWLAKTSSELKALYGYEAYASFMNSYNVLVVYRHIPQDTTIVSGFHSFKIVDNKMQITLNEYEVETSHGSEHDQRMLAFICIPKSEFQTCESPSELELTSNMISYYKSSTIPANYVRTKYDLILNINYGEFVNDFDAEKIPQISAKTFEKYYLIAIKDEGGRCDCCHNRIGYHSFFTAKDKMHLSLDIEKEEGILCDLLDRLEYDLVLVPKEEFPPIYTFNYQNIKVHKNEIVVNYQSYIYKDMELVPDIEIPDIMDSREYETPKYYREYPSTYTVVANGVVYEQDQIFLDGVFEPNQKSQYIALSSKQELEKFTLLKHESIDESIFNNNYIVAILQYLTGPSIGGPRISGFYDGFFNSTSAEIYMDVYYNYNYDATEDVRDIYRLYFVAVPKERVTTLNEVCNLSIKRNYLEQYDIAKYSRQENKAEITKAYCITSEDDYSSTELFNSVPRPSVSFPLIALHLDKPIEAEYIVNSFCYTGECIYIKIQILEQCDVNDEWDNMIFISLLPRSADGKIELPSIIEELKSCPIYVLYETLTYIN